LTRGVILLNKKMGFISILLICLLLLMGCGQLLLQIGIKEPKVIKDLAYDVTKKEDCLIYIEEDDVFVPYLVLSSDYGGNTLLLRQYLLDDPMPFNVNKKFGWSSHEYGAYYEGSYIDNYLNTEFIETLSQPARDAIVDSTIVITDKSSLGNTTYATMTISRKIFLLSLKEFNNAEFSITADEGKALKFFTDDFNRRVADFSDGKKSPNWTRTPSIWGTYNVITIGSVGTGSGMPDSLIGVRPAFCLDSSTPISQRTDIISDQAVYVLADTDS